MIVKKRKKKKTRGDELGERMKLRVFAMNWRQIQMTHER